jgi:hypothetical protein
VIPVLVTSKKRKLRRWTEEEVEFLKENFNKLSRQELIERLGRTWFSIKFKAKRLGLVYKRVCPVCGKEFTARSPKAIYCSRKCFYKAYYARRLKEKRKRYYLKHREAELIAQRKWKEEMYVLWGFRGYVNHTDPVVKQSELFVAKEVLPKLGFTDIVLTREFSAFFPCDILAKKDGQIYLIEVTLQYERKLNPRILPLVKFLNARVCVCHVKPDFTVYFLKEVDVNKKLYSSCAGEFKAWLEKVGNHAYSSTSY